MSELPKREMALVGAACAVCCAPLIVGVALAAPILAAAGGGLALAAGATALIRHRSKSASSDPQ